MPLRVNNKYIHTYMHTYIHTYGRTVGWRAGFKPKNPRVIGLINIHALKQAEVTLNARPAEPDSRPGWLKLRGQPRDSPKTSTVTLFLSLNPPPSPLPRKFHIPCASDTYQFSFPPHTRSFPYLLLQILKTDRHELSYSRSGKFPLRIITTGRHYKKMDSVP